jgi:glycosyltransferase involved in cell wall biosynthesis
MELKYSVILHKADDSESSSDIFEKTFNSVVSSSLKPESIIIISNDNADLRNNNFPGKILFVEAKEQYSDSFLAAIDCVSTDHCILINNTQFAVKLKQDCAGLLLQSAAENEEVGMSYADYSIVCDGRTTDVNLLGHHSGRLRNEQDLGYLFLIKQDLVQKFLIDASIGIDNALYSLKLNISEVGELAHISSAKGGTLYSVFRSAADLDIYDYLLTDESTHQESENILTQHLKRINAYLSPGQNYKTRPLPAVKPELKASVIIPVNDRPEFIGTAIESVWAQTNQNIEVIIIVNGGPEDKTIEIVQQFMETGSRYNFDKPPVRLIVSDINNIGFSLNQGVRQARGEYYVQLDSDDKLKPDAIDNILALFDTDDQIGIVVGSYELWDLADDGTLVQRSDLPVVTHAEWTENNGRNNLLRLNGAGAPRAIPIQLIRDMGYFRMNSEPYAVNYGEDYDMVLRISEHHRVGRIYEPIYEVIRHRGGTDHSIDQTTIDRNDEAKDYMRLQAVFRRKNINSQN